MNENYTWQKHCTHDASPCAEQLRTAAAASCPETQLWFWIGAAVIVGTAIFRK